MWHIYMLKCSDDSIYTGITTDLLRRIGEHNHSPKGAKYTRTRRPVELIHSESYDDKSSASKREYQIKQLSKIQKLSLVK
ncbi:MAG: GIY-YIG nuclease family protein [Sulfurimonas sp.]|nr:GIY-YIG nuclease family protein [Sulfurimonas sp.]